MDADEQTIAQTEALAEFLTQYAQDGGDLDPENAPEEMRERAPGPQKIQLCKGRLEVIKRLYFRRQV